MNICLDISQIVYEGTGVSRFTYQLVKQILACETQHTWTFFFSSLKNRLHADIEEDILNSKVHKLLRWYAPPRLLSMMWNEPSIRVFGPIPSTYDLIISSDWTQPPPRIAQRKGTIVHDLVFREHPETVDPLILSTQNKRLLLVSKECDVIWCDSQSTASDLKKYYPDAKGKIIVNYPGVNAPRLSKPGALFSYPFKPREYIFSVGKIEPRKNLQRLIKAFRTIIRDKDYAHLTLVIAGPKGWDIESPLLSHPQIQFLGPVNDDQLALLYSQALCFVYPSLYEGFGIPPLEAMSLGCPVILSNTSSLPEIATHDSALFIDPKSTRDIESSLRCLASQPELRERLVLNGYQNVKRFTWDKYIRTMLESIETLQ